MTTLHDRRTALVLILVCLTMSCGSSIAAPASARGAHSKLVYPGPDGKLRYQGDENGNTIPDFSNCGYMGGGVEIPDVPTKATLEPVANSKDDTDRIQKAIDRLSKTSPGAL